MRYACAMRRAALLLLFLAGCPVSGDECALDVDCEGGDVCARDHSCLPASEVRAVRASWTINGVPASAEVCGEADLYIEFTADDRDDRVQFQPVPCFAGQFSVDKLPSRMDRVELGTLGGGDRDTATFDAEGNAQLDLSL
jgi:hypothetical protein